MSCHSIDPYLGEYVERHLPEADWRYVQTHLEVCEECRAELRRYENLRSSLKALPVRRPPAALSFRIRVEASRAAARRRGAVGLAARAAARLRYWTHELMRPFAIPFAGGLCSALVLFSMLAPPLLDRAFSPGADVPTMLSTEASLKGSLPYGVADGIVVDLIIDDQGRMIDYSFPDGADGLPYNQAVRREIENRLIFTRFEPATAFGQPTPGRVRISFRRSVIDVKG